MRSASSTSTSTVHKVSSSSRGSTFNSPPSNQLQLNHKQSNLSTNQDDEITVEDLLYDAQMEMIAHRHDKAIYKLEQAVERNSSAACATLANLYSKGYCRPDHSHSSSSSVSPPSTSSLAASSSVSPPSLSHSTTSRPRMPARSTSWNCHQQHQGHRSQESIKATQLYLKGLEIELDKPVESNEGNKKRGRRRMEEMESSEEDERAEGKYWNLQSALDLIVGVTDAHRFGVLQPPSTTSDLSRSNNSNHSNDSSESLWAQSSIISSRVLSHPTIAPIISSVSTRPSTSPSRPQFLSRSTTSTSTSTSRPQTPRTSSVSRSYTHPATTLPDQSTQRTPQRKLSLTIAIHALYILALQAFSSPSPPSIPSIPTPDASPLLIDQTPIASSPSMDVPTPQTESGKNLSSTLFHLILLLAEAEGGIVGIKEGDELVSRAQRRLDGIWNISREGEEDWKLVKSEKSKRLRAERKSTESSVLSGSGGQHGKERSDSSNVTITPGSFVGRNNNNNHHHSKFHFVDVDEEETKDAYPSPPDTPPQTEPASASTKQLAPLDVTFSSVEPPITTTTTKATPYERSPPLASPLQPRYNPASHSQSSTHLSTHTRVRDPNEQRNHHPHSHSRRTSLSSFRTTSSSILSRRFKDPSTGLLRRVESSTSVCTVPPDFGATRLKTGDKGKGKAIDPSTLGLGGMGIRFGGKGEMVRVGIAQGEGEDRKVGKSWLGRFFSVSGLTPLRECSGVRERLRDALKRDLQEKEGQVEYVMDWGDEEEPTEDEEEQEITQASSPEPELRRTSPSPSPSATPALSPATATTNANPSRPSNPRRQSSQKSLHSASASIAPRSKRSFVLNDPTTSSPSPDSLSPPSPSSQRNHRRHPSDQFLSPLTATKPKPVAIDPLLLELERSSRVGVRTVCQSCKKKGLNFPACRKCSKNYCSRNCRMNKEVHECAREKEKEGGVKC